MIHRFEKISNKFSCIMLVYSPLFRWDVQTWFILSTMFADSDPLSTWKFLFDGPIVQSVRILWCRILL